MKFTMELSPLELRATITNGSLLALADSVSEAEREVKEVMSEVNKTVFAQKQESEQIQYQAPVQQQPVYQAPVQQPIQQQQVYQAPVQQQAPIQQFQQTQMQQQPPAAVPTSAPTYSSDQLAQAATQLVDAGMRPQLVNLLAQFGIQALQNLPKEQYGAFATQLRAMGAKI
jgi:hypothetical protein